MGPATDDSQINLTFTSSEDTTDFTYSLEDPDDVQISGGTIRNFTGSGKVYTAVFTPTPSGYEKYTISVPENVFTDGNGNLNVASNMFEWTYIDQIQPFPSNYSKQWYLEKIKFKDYFQNETQRQDLLSQLARSSVKIAINDYGVQQKDDNNPNNTEINDFNKLDKSLSKGFNVNGTEDNRWWPLNNNDDHGTMCGSMAVSSGNKLYGTAPGLPFVSTRHDYFVSSIGNSLGYENQQISVYSCSWGSFKGYTSNDPQINDAIVNGSQNGRSGKGCVYVFASGNDTDVGDSAVFEYTLNLAETLSVGATNIDDKRAYYSETGANLLCVAPGGEQQFFNPDGVIVFNNDYNLEYVQGTSFSCPLVSGLCGVMLTLRNDLTWRDVKEVISKSCIKNDPEAGGSGADNTPWFTNQVGRPFNLQYGFGLIDYGTVISNTQIHTLLPVQNGFIVSINKNIDLSQPQEISFVIDGNTNPIQINDDIPLTENFNTFIIQEFVIVFGILQDGSDSNNEVHELSISLSVEGRGYATDYTDQAITNGRKVAFNTISYGKLSSFIRILKRRKISG